MCIHTYICIYVYIFFVYLFAGEFDSIFLSISKQKVRGRLSYQTQASCFDSFITGWVSFSCMLCSPSLALALFCSCSRACACSLSRTSSLGALSHGLPLSVSLSLPPSCPSPPRNSPPTIISLTDTHTLNTGSLWVRVGHWSISRKQASNIYANT